MKLQETCSQTLRVRNTSLLRESICNQTDVALNITKHLFSKKADNENIVFSPLSIHVVLSILSAGSNGPTRISYSPSSDSYSPTISTPLPLSSPPLYSPMEVQPAGLACVSQMHVEVMKEVNSWAEKETNGLIKDVLQPGSVDSLTWLIFANALYFKGAWNEKFDASITKDYDFHLLNGNSVKVPFMISKKNQFISAFDDFKVLGLPYKQGGDKRRFSMFFLLPDPKDGLSALVEKVGSESGFLERKLRYNYIKVKVGDFRIPRFKISFGFEASNLLKELGLVLPFTEGDLTEMVDSPVGQELYVSKIFHKSFIEVNEEGTEAAATSVIMMHGSSPFANKTKIDFVADHPFLFLIREDMTGTILFIGQVLNPLAD